MSLLLAYRLRVEALEFPPEEVEGVGDLVAEEVLRQLGPELSLEPLRPLLRRVPREQPIAVVPRHLMGSASQRGREGETKE